MSPSVDLLVDKELAFGLEDIVVLFDQLHGKFDEVSSSADHDVVNLDRNDLEEVVLDELPVQLH